jgi:8-oxo-dGTP pyrophosphatase MutT (NUDIX family)
MIWTPHAVVATIVQREQRFLLVEEIVDGETVYNQPAGHIDANERIMDAAVRETLEETGYRVRLDHLTGIYTVAGKGGVTYYRFCFAASFLEDTGRPLDQGIVGPRWFTMDEIRGLGSRLRSPLVVKCLEDYQAGRRFPLDIIFEHPDRFA